MRKLIFILTVLIAAAGLNLSAQEPQRRHAPVDIKTLTYQQTDEVRNALGLDQKLFGKVYKEYKKYNEAVYGSLTPQRQGPPPEGGHRGPGMGGGRPHGGQPGMGHNHESPRMRPGVNPEGQAKTIAKQEEKLSKAMKKILKTPVAFDKWQKIRMRQIEAAKPKPAPNRPHR